MNQVFLLFYTNISYIGKEFVMIDLRSDTVTKLTPEMREAAYRAEVGDDVFGEDPTVQQLEEEAAAILGKEAALFVTSGTQGNQVAVLTHCQPGNEIILEEDSHIMYYEGAAIAALAGVQPRTILGNRGEMDLDKVKKAIRAKDIHFPETQLICLENTHNRAGGAIISHDYMKELYDLAQSYHIPIHLDGARLFHASVATGISLRAYAAYADTVSICLSKGLGAPVGSLLAGKKETIERARKWRKRLGGGMRQAGIIAAPGLVALRTMVERLAEDHEKAKTLAAGLQEIKKLALENIVETNIVVINVEKTGKDSVQIVELLKKEGIYVVPFGPYSIRMTTHYNVSFQDIDKVLRKLHTLFS